MFGWRSEPTKENDEKAQDCKDAVADLKEEQRELRQELFDNTATQYDSYIARIEQKQTYIQNYIDRAEMKGNVVSAKYYNSLIGKEQSSLEKYKEERNKLYSQLKAGLNKGDIAYGSEAWYEMQAKIDEVRESIQMCTNNIVEFQNEIRQISWDNFDYLHDSISQVTEEASFLLDLFSDNKLFDDKGSFTNDGLSSLALHGVNHNIYMEQSQSYAREVEELNKQIAKTPNDKELINRRNEILKLQQESIRNANAEKQAMIDLAEEGYNLQLSSMKELIDNYNKTLDSEKSLYEYRKKTKEQTKEIAKIEKMISAYQGDNSEETKAKVQQLKIDLEEAKDNLQETEYDKYVSDQQDLLDAMYEDFETLISEKLENTDALFSQLISDVNLNSDAINQSLKTETDKVGYMITDGMETVFGASDTILSDFSNGFKDFSGKFDAYTQNATTNIESLLGSINSNIVAMINSGDATATRDLEHANSNQYLAKKDEPKETNAPAPKEDKTKDTSKDTSKNSSKNSITWWIKKASDTPKNKLNLNSLTDRLKYHDFDSSFSARKKYWSKMGFTGTYAGSAAQNTKMLSWMKSKGYKSGAYKIPHDELAWTQEDNPEFIIRPSDGAVLTPLAKNDSVLNARASANLWDMSNNPNEFIRNNLSGDYKLNTDGNNNNASTIQNDVNIGITLPNVTNYNEFINALQRDSKFERLIQDMTVNQLNGKSSLSKYKHKFK